MKSIINYQREVAKDAFIALGLPTIQVINSDYRPLPKCEGCPGDRRGMYYSCAVCLIAKDFETRCK